MLRNLPVSIMNITNTISYEKSLEYWADVPATLDGVLGGFGFISDVDLEGSKLFLDSLYSTPNAPSNSQALDCGAGIGRITKNLLLPRFKSVDVIEPDEKFINSIKDFVGEDRNKLGSLYMLGLQQFCPEKKYDVIWNQWVLGYLTDDDLVSYLSICRQALSKNGIIVIKENVTSSGIAEKDETDSSVTRSLKHFQTLFKKANLKRMKQCKQTNFPNGIYPVYMFALVPLSNNSELEISSPDEQTT